MKGVPSMSTDGHRPTIREAQEDDYDTCIFILRSLSKWFTQDVIDSFASEQPSLTSLVAEIDDRVVGFLTLKFHNEYSADLSAVAVLEEFHHQGIGSMLLNRAEQMVRERGCRFFQVKTLGPSHPSPYYARTRDFYLARGFVPLEELHGLWGRHPCLIMIKYLSPPNEHPIDEKGLT